MNAIVCIALLATLFAVQEASGQVNVTVTVTGDAFLDYLTYLRVVHNIDNPHWINVHRFKKFRRCYNELLSHNPNKAGYNITLNKFSHWTDDEWNGTLNYNLGESNITASSNTVTQDLRQNVALPTTVDWVAAGAVSAVKDQGSCGNCYTFGAAGALEGQYQIQCGILVNVSSEQYTDCSQGYQAATSTITSCRNGICTTSSPESWTYRAGSGNQGCNGGTPASCWAWNNMTSTASVTAECYPLTASVSAVAGKCTATNCATNIKVANYARVPAKDEVTMARVLATVGPLACSIDANPIQPYAGGVYSGKCGSSNHIILVVGYGIWTDGVTPYWKVKNSWGTDWGVNGYFYVFRGNNTLNIASNCAYPILATC